jgi:hypothetical protein
MIKRKNILAENMLRFRTKNLVEQTKVNSSIYGTRFGTYTLQEMAGLINTYNPLSGYIAISDGNEWLANQRAKSLSQFFSKNVSNILGVPYNSEAVEIEEAKVLGPGAENQYVQGTLYAILEKPGQPEQTYKYSLLYNFYEVDGLPHIIVTKSGKGTPNPRTSIAGADQLAREYVDKNPGTGGSTIAGTGTKPETRKIGEFKFDKTMFADNMIGIQNTRELQAKIQEIKKAYDVVVSANIGFEVKSISSLVRGYSSSDAANNRTASGKPDHGWGINWPAEKWITK